MDETTLKDMFPLTYQEPPKPPEPVVESKPEPQPKAPAPKPSYETHTPKPIAPIKPNLAKIDKTPVKPTPVGKLTKADMTIERVPEKRVAEADEALTPSHHPQVLEHFGLKVPLSNGEESNLTRVLEFVGNQPLLKQLTALNKLESKLGQPRLHESRLERLAGYVKIQGLVKDAEEWRKSLMRN